MTKKKVRSSDANVFFLDTGESTVNVSLGPREACAVESAARSNPDLKVLLLFSSYKRFQNLQATPTLDAILSYPNVVVNFFNATLVSQRTPMEEFIKTDVLSHSKFKVEHTSDALRLILMLRVGGTYLDLDMITQKRLDSVPSNYACAESGDLINNAFLNFDKKKGKAMLTDITETFVQNYNAENYSYNGPTLLTAFAKKRCKADKISDIISGDCDGFHIMKKEVCYPIPSDQWKDLMTEEAVEETMKKVNDSITVHFNHHVSKDFKININSKAPYVQLAKRFCPKVFATCKDEL